MLCRSSHKLDNNRRWAACERNTLEVPEKRDKDTICSLLERGVENAISLRELELITGQNQREIRRRVHFERRAGMLIMSDSTNGYFLPASPDDIRRFAKSMSHRAKSIAQIACLAEHALADMEGQECIAGWDDTNEGASSELEHKKMEKAVDSVGHQANC